MKTSRHAKASRKLIGEIQLAKLRLARAESQLNLAREQSRLAKRQRKEAKQAARRARKQARQAKGVFKQAKLLLAEAQTRLAWARRLRARLGARRRLAPKTITKARRGKVSPPHRVVRKSTAKSRVALPAKTRRPPPPRAVKRRAPAARKAETKTSSISVPREFETPTSAFTTPEGHAPMQAEEGVGQGLTTKHEAEKAFQLPPEGDEKRQS